MKYKRKWAKFEQIHLEIPIRKKKKEIRTYKTRHFRSKFKIKILLNPKYLLSLQQSNKSKNKKWRELNYTFSLHRKRQGITISFRSRYFTFFYCHFSFFNFTFIPVLIFHILSPSVFFFYFFFCAGSLSLKHITPNIK